MAMIEAMRRVVATVTAIRFALSAPCDVLVDLPTRNQKGRRARQTLSTYEAVELVGGECYRGDCNETIRDDRRRRRTGDPSCMADGPDSACRSWQRRHHPPVLREIHGRRSARRQASPRTG